MTTQKSAIFVRIDAYNNIDVTPSSVDTANYYLHPIISSLLEFKDMRKWRGPD